MKNYILIYDDCCFYEIVTICYYLKFTNNNIVFCSLNGEKITCTEGTTIEANRALSDIKIEDVLSFILPDEEEAEHTMYFGESVDSYHLK